MQELSTVDKKAQQDIALKKAAYDLQTEQIQFAGINKSDVNELKNLTCVAVLRKNGVEDSLITSIEQIPNEFKRLYDRLAPDREIYGTVKTRQFAEEAEKALKQVDDIAHSKIEALTLKIDNSFAKSKPVETDQTKEVRQLLQGKKASDVIKFVVNNPRHAEAVLLSPAPELAWDLTFEQIDRIYNINLRFKLGSEYNEFEKNLAIRKAINEYKDNIRSGLKKFIEAGDKLNINL